MIYSNKKTITVINDSHHESVNNYTNKYYRYYKENPLCYNLQEVKLQHLFIVLVISLFTIMLVI